MPNIARHLALVTAVTLPWVACASDDGPPSPEEQAAQLAEALAQPRPIDALNTVWIEEMTWMEVRDALADGTTTAIIATGGIEQNGPYTATGKHNFVLQGACEDLAMELGNALCAPIIKLVPEGDYVERTGHMAYPGTLSLRQETFEMVLDDVASSLAAHGFEHLILIGDSGGNQRGLAAVADRLNERWGPDAASRAHHIPEFYNYDEVLEYMENDLGVRHTTDDGLHDNFYITAIQMTVDPDAIRYDQRVEAGLTTINGVSITPKEEAIRVGEQLLRFRVEKTAAAVRAAIAGTTD